MKTLRLVNDETYGRDKRAINRHRTKTFEDVNDPGWTFKLSRCLDARPRYFEAFGPIAPNYQGILPVLRMRLNNNDRWGEGLSWKKATALFLDTLPAKVE